MDKTTIITIGGIIGLSWISGFCIGRGVQAEIDAKPWSKETKKYWKKRIKEVEKEESEAEE